LLVLSRKSEGETLKKSVVDLIFTRSRKVRTKNAKGESFE
jgi:hypothetical protein